MKAVSKAPKWIEEINAVFPPGATVGVSDIREKVWLATEVHSMQAVWYRLRRIKEAGLMNITIVRPKNVGKGRGASNGNGNDFLASSAPWKVCELGRELCLNCPLDECILDNPNQLKPFGCPERQPSLSKR